MEPKIKNNILLKSALALALVDLALIAAILLQVNNLVKDVLEVQNKQLETIAMKERLEKKVEEPKVTTKEQAETKVEETGEIKDSLTIDPKTGWQVYRNETFGYEINIPSGWMFKQEGADAQYSRAIFKDSTGRLSLSIHTPGLGFGIGGVVMSEETIVLNKDTKAVKQLREELYENQESRLIFVKWENRTKNLNSGFIFFDYISDYTENAKLFDEILATLKFFN